MDGVAMAINYPDSIHIDSLQVGAEFLDFVMLTLQPSGLYIQPFTSKKMQYAKGESFQGWEIKLDKRCTETGRLSIEIAEKTRATNPTWSPSGIYRNDNTWLYIQGNYTCFWIFLKKTLIAMHKCGKYQEDESYGTVKKFYVPLLDANRYGHQIMCSNATNGR
jgi:hypothetical protein